ncbi:MAG: TonB-dependent receptor domain-containing protein, partial [Janthinobacterium lividum]
VFSKQLNNTTWRVGAVYQPVRGVSIYAQYSTGLDPIGTLTTFSASQTQFKNTTGNQVEGGVKTSFLDGRGSATLAAYRIVKKNLLIQNPDDLKDTTPLQIGQRSARGIEASVSLDLPKGFGIDANGTVLEAKYDEFNTGGVSFTGNTPPNIPQTAANLWLRWNAFDRFQARVGLRYVGHSYSDNANQFRIPGYVVVDGGVGYAITPRIAVDLRVYNLLAKAYATTSYNDEQWILGRPRSVDLALRARF